MRLSWWFFILIAFSLFPSTLFPAITLQPHQEYTVNYLQQHPQQKGLLLYHALGSGKTYLAIAYAESQPEKPVIVLLPRFLKSNWQSQISSYGVKNTQRYQLVTLEDAWEKLKNIDLSKTILVIDEIHKLVNQIRYASASEGEKYSQLYAKLKSADKIIALTGTPIFSHASDIAYIGNMLAADEKFPYNSEQFRQQYMAIKPNTALWRGHVSESKWTYLFIPFWATLSAVITLATASTPLIIIPVVAMTGGALLPQLNEWFPVHNVSFREFRADLLQDFAKNYVSFYALKEENLKDYPRKEIIEETADYTPEQSEFFLNFADEDLKDEELNLLLADSDVQYSKAYLKLNTHTIQKHFLFIPNEGRQIGNLPLLDKKGKLSEPSKFQSILAEIKSQPGRVAIYSNYYHNGIMQFAQFLDRQQMKDQYVVLTPDLEVDEQIARIAAYNTGKKRIILIHPEITEGISLLETEHFHILEPVSNIALLDQIIGRAVRFQSHKNLPENRRLVKIHLWEAKINYGMYSEASRMRRNHWQRRYSEVNPNLWSKGILELDTNYFRKDEAPDTRVKRNQNAVSADMASFENLIKQYSIEKKI